MKKIKAVRWKPRQHEEKLKSIDILAKNTRQRQKTLTELVWRHELTDAINILEEYGFSGDLGIFVIRQVQDRLGRAAQ